MRHRVRGAGLGAGRVMQLPVSALRNPSHSEPERSSPGTEGDYQRSHLPGKEGCG